MAVDIVDEVAWKTTRSCLQVGLAYLDHATLRPDRPGKAPWTLNVVTVHESVIFTAEDKNPEL